MAADRSRVRRLRTGEPDELALANEPRDVAGLALAAAGFVAAVTIDAVTPRLPFLLGLTLEVGGYSAVIGVRWSSHTPVVLTAPASTSPPSTSPASFGGAASPRPAEPEEPSPEAGAEKSHQPVGAHGRAVSQKVEQWLSSAQVLGKQSRVAWLALALPLPSHS